MAENKGVAVKLRKMRKQPGSGRLIVDGVIVDKRNGFRKDGSQLTATIRPKGVPVLKDGVWYFDYSIPSPSATITEPQNLSLAKRLLAWFKRYYFPKTVEVFRARKAR